MATLVAMRVLLTNDDGLRAPGIVALYEALMDEPELLTRAAGPSAADMEVVPIAPLTVQSATSHGVTFHQPLMVEDVQVTDRMRGVAVDGRPADCVKLAISAIWPETHGPGERPDLLVSGMNAGANCGINVIYSGTVAAALEGAFLGVPSVAVSLMLGRGEALFDLAARRARAALAAVLGAGLLEPHACININIPVTEEDGPEELPLRVCPMNTHGLVDAYERRVSPGGDVYYWAAGGGLDFHEVEDHSDVHALFEGAVAVTPLWYDLTRHSDLQAWRDALGNSE